MVGKKADMNLKVAAFSMSVAYFLHCVQFWWHSVQKPEIFLGRLQVRSVEGGLLGKAAISKCFIGGDTRRQAGYTLGFATHF